MAKVYMNHAIIEIDTFNRNTYFNDNIMTSTGYIGISDQHVTAASLHSLAEETITSFQIKNGEDVIYDAGEIEAHITSIDESLMGDRMHTNINIQFQ